MTSRVTLCRYFPFQRRWQRVLKEAVLIVLGFTFVGFCLLTGLGGEPGGTLPPQRRSILQAPESSSSSSSPADILSAGNATEGDTPLFPPDLFTKEQLRQGAVLLYVLSVAYLLLAEVLVIKEFFVPSLQVLSQRLHISDDVVGASFMAAWTSAPQLLTSVIGVIISFNGVGQIKTIGIGTIVGSAVFHILFVVAMCSLFSKTTLDLTCCPIVRDLTFYSIALVMLAAFFLDGFILWYEALFLLGIYLFYCLFMGFNKAVKSCVVKRFYKNSGARVWAADQIDPSTEVAENEEDVDSKPIDLSWPDTAWKKITYVIVAPVIFPLWLTLPDVRTPRGKRYFVVTFLGSIIWMVIFFYLMVWCLTVVSGTMNIPSEVMGLTILAAVSSPDLIASVIVARKGLGDMAVSSSIGRNIFEVCVGLPVPWLIRALGQLILNFVNEVEDPWRVNPIKVSTEGMACSILLLFCMMLFALISIMCSRWKLNKCLGATLLFLYILFVCVSLTFHYDLVKCPL